MRTTVRKKSGKKISIVWLPYTFLTTYIMLTLVISMFGPIEYPNYTPERKFIVSLYVIMFLIITWFGMYGNSKYKTNNIKEKGGEKHRKVISRISSIIKIVMVIKIMLLVSSIIKFGLPTFTTFSNTLARIYTDLHREEPVGNIYRQIDTFTTFLSDIAIIGGLYVWRDLETLIRFFLMLILLVNLTYNFFYLGTQRILFTYVIYILMIYVVKTVRKRGAFRIRNVILVSLIALVVGFLFSAILSERLEYWGSSRPLTTRSGLAYNMEHPLLWLIPNDLRYQIITIMAYPTQGYYGLSLCLSMPFEWTYGLGASRGLNSIMSQIISVPNVISATYPLRAEAIYGYSGLANWHTIFPWLASDLTFLGALLYMGFVALIYMKCWKQVIEYDNPISFVLLTLLTIQYIFVPANNQLFIGRGSSMGIVLIFLIWLTQNKKLNFAGQYDA